MLIEDRRYSTNWWDWEHHLLSTGFKEFLDNLKGRTGVSASLATISLRFEAQAESQSYGTPEAGDFDTCVREVCDFYGRPVAFNKSLFRNNFTFMDVFRTREKFKVIHDSNSRWYAVQSGMLRSIVDIKTEKARQKEHAFEDISYDSETWRAWCSSTCAYGQCRRGCMVLF